MKSVVVIDDVSAVRKSMAELLKAWGYTVQAYETAEEALTHSDQLRAAGCVILDYQLPGMNGLGFVQSLQTAGIEAPVIVVSGSVRKLNTDLLYSAGVKAVLSKPIPGDILIEHIEDLIGPA